MTDEEMAEEYIEKNCKIWEEGELTVNEIVRLAYLAGLKAGRPQWHDLRKEKNDLPKHTNSVLGYCRGDYYDVCFFNGKRLIGHGESDFLKWKEIE